MGQRMEGELGQHMKGELGQHMEGELGQHIGQVLKEQCLREFGIGRYVLCGGKRQHARLSELLLQRQLLGCQQWHHFEVDSKIVVRSIMEIVVGSMMQLELDPIETERREHSGSMMGQLEAESIGELEVESIVVVELVVGSMMVGQTDRQHSGSMIGQLEVRSMIGQLDPRSIGHLEEFQVRLLQLLQSVGM